MLKSVNSEEIAVYIKIYNDSAFQISLENHSRPLRKLLKESTLMEVDANGNNRNTLF